MRLQTLDLEKAYPGEETKSFVMSWKRGVSEIKNEWNKLKKSNKTHWKRFQSDAKKINKRILDQIDLVDRINIDGENFSP